jgi:hypothetical protein
MLWSITEEQVLASAGLDAFVVRTAGTLMVPRADLDSSF